MSSAAFFPPGRQGPLGERGVRGPQGPVGPGITWRGALQFGPDFEGNAIVYSPNDVVEFDGSSYLVRQEFVGQQDFYPGTDDFPDWEDYFEPVARKGAPGQPGQPGATGAQGVVTKGNQGPPGKDGFPGTYVEWLEQEGNAGRSYAAFLSEITGAEGQEGEPGIPGTYQEWLDRGNTGEYEDFLETLRGNPGPTGFPGTYEEYRERVNPAASYEQFLNAIRGRQGDQGDTGSQGEQGEQGEQGTPGTYADWLAQGNLGSYGQFLEAIRGPQGIQGEPGFPGTYQEWLDLGNTGPYGDFLEAITGPQGIQGAHGLPGTYIEWIERGNQGTYGDFLNIIRGPKGNMGPTGERGAQGLPGSAIYKGDQGPPGPTGPKGPPGLRGVNWLGPWDPDYPYEKNDGVLYQGGSWICVSDSPSTDQTPGFTGDWEMLAERGSVIGVKGPRGDKGEKGDTGPPGIEWRGTWDPETDYKLRDAVFFQGASYRRIFAGVSAGLPDTDTDNWVLLVEKGDDGAPGPQGPQGVTGLPGGGTQQSIWLWDANPVSGAVAASHVGVDTAQPSQAKFLKISKVGQLAGIDWSVTIGVLEAGDHIYAQAKGDAASWHRWEITGAPVATSGYYTIPITTDAGSPQGTEPASDAEVLVAFQFQPLQGAAGPPGADGDPGLIWRGAWSAATAYAENDAVYFDGSSYRREIPGTTAKPPDEDVPGAAAPVATLVYGSDDQAGLINYLGTNGGQQAFATPVPADPTPTIEGPNLKLIASSAYVGWLHWLVDHNPAGFTTWDTQQSAANPSTIIFDFKTRKLRPTRFHISAATQLSASYRPTAFAIDGSNDNAAWTQLASYNGGEFSGWCRLPITGVTEPYRYLRFRQTAPSVGSGWAFGAGEMEFFGEVFETAAAPNWVYVAKGGEGEDGAPGPAGLIWRGAWNPVTAYAVNDAVTYDGSSWRRIVAGTTPTNPKAETAGLNLTWTSDGDANGLIYYLGATKPGTAFACPVPQATALTLTGADMTLRASSMYNTGFSPYHAVDRSDSVSWATTGADPDKWVSIELAGVLKLRPNRVAIKSRVENWPTTWVLEGSTDGTTWTLIHTQATAVHTAGGQWKSVAVTSAVSYKHLRLRGTGVMNDGATYWGFQEFEFYGLVEGALPIAPAWELLAAGGAGEPGPAGTPGPAGAPGLDWKGTWSAATAYVIGDAVQRNGSSYRALKAGTGFDPEAVETTPSVELTRTADADTNGVFYRLGTLPTGTWASPVAQVGGTSPTGTHLNLATKGAQGGYDAYLLVDRASSAGFYAGFSDAGNYISFDLKTRRLVLKTVALQAPSDYSYTFKGVIIEGSDDGTTWTTLADLADTGLNAANKWVALPIVTTTAYRYFRLRMKNGDRIGSQYLQMREVELYGTLYDGVPTLADPYWAPVALKGAVGATGLPGLVWRGAWAAATAYAINDAVTHEGSSYRRIVAGTTSQSPAEEGPPADLALTYVSDGDANGVVSHLGKLTGGGTFVTPIAATNAVVEIGAQMAMRASSVNSLPFGLAKAVDRTNSNGWAGTGLANEWIEIDLLTNKLAPNKLSLRARADDSRYAPATVKLEGSNDRTAWTLLKGAIATGFTTSNSGVWKSFDIPGITEKYRYLRVTSTGLSASGDNNTQLGEIEFYGALGTPAPAPNWEPVALKGEDGEGGSGGAGGSDITVISDLADKPTAASAGSGTVIYIDVAGTQTPLTWTSNGDTKGLVYYLGTDGRTKAFACPVPLTPAYATELIGSRLTVRTQSSDTTPPYQAPGGVDRDSLTSYCSASGGVGVAYYELDLGVNQTLKCNRFAMKQIDSSTNWCANFKVQGSNNGTAWTDLLTVTSAVAPGALAWKDWPVVGAGTYRYHRVFMTGVDSSGQSYLAFNEIEFYGEIYEATSPAHRLQVSDGVNWYTVATGQQMANGTAEFSDSSLPSVALKWVGVWDSATPYVAGDAVVLAGVAYLAIAPSTNQTPPNAAYWVKIQGPPGPQGPQGELGPSGDPYLSSTATTFTYVSLGDTNGLVYWLGTRGGTFANPVPMIDGLELHGANVSLRASSIYGVGFEPWRALDRITTNGFSTDSSGGWLEFDFRQRWMRPNRISIRSRPDLTNYPKNFVVEGSNDGTTWVNLLTVSTVQHTAINQWKFWLIGTLPGSDWHKLRIRSTGPMSDGATYLAFGDVEFYGVLTDPGSFVVYDEGVPLPVRGKLDFQGVGITVTDDAPNAKTIITATGSAGTPLVVHEEGSALPARSKMDFRGAGLTVTDDAANATTVVTALGGGGAGSGVTVIADNDDKPKAASAGAGAQILLTDPGVVVPLAFGSHGDTNGLIYYIGTNGRTVAFANPVTPAQATVNSGPGLEITCSGSVTGYDGQYYYPGNVTDRNPATMKSSDSSGWDRYDFKGRSIRPNLLAIRTREQQANSPTPFVLEASNDGTIWTELLSVTASMNSVGTWYSWPLSPVPEGTSYRYLRVRKTVGGYIQYSEIEFYGELATGVLPRLHRLQISDGVKWYSVATGEEMPDGGPAGIALTYASDGDTNGLIYYLGATLPGTAFATPVSTLDLATETGPNLDLTASSRINGSGLQYKAVDRSDSGAFVSAVEIGAWLRFDLKTRKLAPNYLTLRHDSSSNAYVPINFVVEGSDDATAWTTLLTVTNAASSAASAWRRWAIAGAAAYRYLRIRNTGLDSSGGNYLVLGEVEFYGTLT